MLFISINKVFCFELRYETRAFEYKSKFRKNFLSNLIIRTRWKLRSIKIVEKKKEKETRLKNYYF